MPLPVTIIIPSWNSEHCIETCLNQALAQDVESIRVIDNGSRDNTVGIIQRAFPTVEVTRWPKNRGFAAAMNHGIAQSDTPFVFLLNDDCELQPHYVSTLVQALQKTRTAASATGKLLAPDSSPTLDSVGIRLDRYALRPLDEGHGQPDRGQFDSNRSIFGPSGAATLFRKRALDSLNALPFDESLVSYYEDVDLAWRLTNAGWEHLYCYRATGHHLRRGPHAKPAAIKARAFSNRYIVWAKNESLGSFITYGPVALTWEALRIGRRLLTSPEELAEVPAALTRSVQIIKARLRGGKSPESPIVSP